MSIQITYLKVVIKSSCDNNHMNENDEALPALTEALNLEQFWPYQVTVLADRISRRTSRIVKTHGLNLSQWRVMAAIAEVPGRTSVDVVTVTPMDKGIVSRATKALLELGYIRREASQSDGRLSHLHLTDTGTQLYRDIIPTIEIMATWANERLTTARLNRLRADLDTLMEVVPDLR